MLPDALVATRADSCETRVAANALLLMAEGLNAVRTKTELL